MLFFWPLLLLLLLLFANSFAIIKRLSFVLLSGCAWFTHLRQCLFGRENTQQHKTKKGRERESAKRMVNMSQEISISYRHSADFDSFDKWNILIFFPTGSCVLFCNSGDFLCEQHHVIRHRTQDVQCQQQTIEQFSVFVFLCVQTNNTFG